MRGDANNEAGGGFNLSAWALGHPSLITFLILVALVTGALAFVRLGRSEDPKFTVRTMVVRAYWPGATAREVEGQITDRLEKALQEVPYFDIASSFSKPGEVSILVNLKDEVPPAAVAESWYQVRKRLTDIQPSLPAGARGPFFDDDFGDTFGNVYAFHAAGFTDAELKQALLAARQRLLRLKDVAKVQLVGVQDEKIYVTFSHAKLARLGVGAPELFASLSRQNAVTPAGAFELPFDRVYARVQGALTSTEAIAEVPVAANGRLFRLGDIAEVTRSGVDPPATSMRHQGERVVGLAVSMVKGGDILALGHALDAEIAAIQTALPVGIEVARVADQPRIVAQSVDEFLESLAEALAIVLAVSFLTLGLRTGVVVALSVPLVLAITFVVMWVVGIDLHRISLGALIIALGLLVDDAIIAVEMMMVKLEQGYDRATAASFAWTSTAFPMLTGTLVTAAGFIPVGFARSTAGEYTNAIFWVVMAALLISWLVAVLFAPFLGYRLLPIPARDHHDPYDHPAYKRLRRWVEGCVRHRKLVIAVTLALFAASVVGFGLVQQQFFPSSSRLEVVVDLQLAEGSSYHATLTEVERLEAILKADPRVTDIAAYVGTGGPRFYLALSPDLPNANFAQFVIRTGSLADTAALHEDLRRRLAEDFAHLRARASRLENGPPVGYKVQFRVMGPDPDVVRAYAGKVRDVMRQNPHLGDVNLQWHERTKAIDLAVDQNRARIFGLTTEDVAQTLQTLLSGATVTQLREDSELVEVVARAVPAERAAIDRLGELTIRTRSGVSVPLSQVATIRPKLEDGLIWRRNRDASLTVRGDVRDATQAPVVSMEINPTLDAIRAEMPAGYRVEIGGEIEESVKAQASIAAVVPVMILVMLVVLMVQLQSFSRLILVMVTAPLGLIGVTAALLLLRQPFGFVAQLGVIALSGMIIRNSVILVDQIERDQRAGSPAWTAIIDATVRRTRPILLTAAAAILAMIPLAMSNFWGPMAVAIMGGLLGATLLTIFFLPALYAAWYRVAPPPPAPPPMPVSPREMELVG